MRAEIARRSPLGIGGDEGGDGRAVVLDPHDFTVEVHRAALTTYAVAHRFPHLAGTKPGILELVDQRLDHLALTRLEPAKQSVHHSRDQTQALDPLRCPVGRHRAGGDAPNFLGVRLEEGLEEHLAEAIDDPRLEATLGPDGTKSGLDVTQQDAGGPPGTELPERIDWLERVMEKLAAVVDTAQPRAGDERVAQDLAPEGVDLAVLGEEPVAADIEPVPLVFVGPTDPTDQPRIGLEHHARSAVPRELMGAGKARGAAAGDHRLVSCNDGLRTGVINARPAVGNLAGAYRL